MNRFTPEYRRLLLTATVLAVPAVLTATPAVAQSRGGERVTQLRAVYTVRHDSNVSRLGATPNNPRGITGSDQRASPAIAFTLARPLGRNRVSLDASAGYDFYRRNKRLNRERLSFAGVGNVGAGPCDVTLSPTFSRRQSDLGEIALIGTPGIDSVRNVQTTQDYLGELRCGNPNGLRPMGTFQRSIGDNSAERRKISDYRSTRYGGGLSYGNPILGEYSVQFLRDDTDYPNRPPSFLSGDGFRTDRIDLRGSRDIGAVLVANGSISYIRLRPDQATVGKFNGLGWSLGLTATPAPDLSISGGLSRNVAPALLNDALYQVAESYNLRATYAVNRLWNASLGGSISRQRFAGAGDTFGPPLRNSVNRTVNGTLAYAYSERLGMALDVGYQTRSANNAIYEFNNVYAALRTTLTL